MRMSIWLLIAAAACAQEGRFYGPLAAGQLKLRARALLAVQRPQLFLQGPPPAEACSVPLLVVPLPPSAQFPMPKLQTAPNDSMPRVMPVPVCEPRAAEKE